MYLIALMALQPIAASAQDAAPCSDCGDIIIPERHIPVKAISLKRGFGTYVLSRVANRTRALELRLGKGLSPKGTWVRSVTANSFEVHFTSGDRILWHDGDHLFATLTFADGTDWRIDDVREFANIGSAHNTVLHGGPEKDDFDTRGYAHLVIGGGGGLSRRLRSRRACGSPNGR